MERKFIDTKTGQYPYINDTTLIGKWEEVADVPANTINRDLSNERLDGMLLYGYEMKWGVTNANGERYEQTAFDKFINEYFVEKGLNMAVDINHEGWHNWHAICGRVLYIERNTTGFYFVVYVPRTYVYYGELLNLIKAGIIQGFSKEGYATEWEWRYKEDGTFDYELIKEMALVSVSLVTAPANGVSFERAKETKNALTFVVKEVEKKTQSGKSLADMFNNK